MKDQNERRVLVATVLSLLVSMVWLFLVRSTAPPEPPPGAPTSAEAPAAGASAGTTAGTTAGVTAETAPAPAQAQSTACVDEAVPLNSELVHLELNRCGGAITGIEVPSVAGPITVTPVWTWLWGKLTGNHTGPWEVYAAAPGAESLLSEQGQFALVGRGAFDVGPARARGWETLSTAGGVTLRSHSADGLTITRSVTPTADPEVFDLSVTWSSVVPLQGPLWVAIADRLVTHQDPYGLGTRLMLVENGDLTDVLDPVGQAAEPLRSQAGLQWMGLNDRYFLSALLPDVPSAYELVVQGATLPGTEGSPLAAFAVLNKDLSPDVPVQSKFRLYVGPKNVERLAVVGQSLDEAANLGFWGFFAKILLFFLHLFYQAIGNWGAAIVALTFMVRIVFYPLSARAYTSAKAMQVVQPELKALQEKYADDKEALNREMVKLFAEHKVNPLSGCLPMLVQMPVFFALYSALQHTPDLYQAQFLYLQDLSAPDPYGLLPTLMAVGMVVQQRMTPMSGMDPTQQAIMRFMPLLFAGFMFSVPAGLSVYYAVNTVLAIVQQWYNTRTYGSLSKPEPQASG